MAGVSRGMTAAEKKAREASLPEEDCSCGHYAVSAAAFYDDGAHRGRSCLECYRTTERDRQRAYRNSKAAVPLKSANHPKPDKNSGPGPELAAARAVVRAAAAAKRLGVPGHVYLAGEEGNLVYVKIGHTYQTPPEARLAGGQTFNPRKLVMLAKKPGTPEDEKALHAKYIRYNVLGEWFAFTPEMMKEFTQ
jgi:hypothetical protein